MKRHVGSVGECLSADDTTERFLARVNPEMLFQQHFPRERLGTVRARMRFQARVYPNVHVISDSLIKTLPAIFAGIFFPIPVDFHVRA